MIVANNSSKVIGEVTCPYCKKDFVVRVLSTSESETRPMTPSEIGSVNEIFEEANGFFKKIDKLFDKIFKKG